ncbi:ATP-binding protein [Rhizorhabdus phycosphaerae]|uniref:ATP-binding protein n=1 Tax=Rhizorhabdus phycosphaerae TaxID=2711156 RepID=UPI0013ED9EC8|nr:ATP-binding protein [Rhizorhabdus phycosphaerae]
MTKASLRPLRGPALVVQIVMLLLGGLVVAQIVTLLLTVLLPPAPTPQYHLDSVAAALRGQKVAGNLRRDIQTGPPDLGGRGWLVSERSRRDLANMLGADPLDVRLSFYTPLPFAGTVATRKMAMAGDGAAAPREAWLHLSAGTAAPDDARPRLILAQATMPPVRPLPPGAQGILLPNGVRLPPSRGAPNRDMLPPEVRPQRDGGRAGTPIDIPAGREGQRPFPGALFEIDPTPLQGRDGIWIGGDRGETIPEILGGPQQGGEVITLPPFRPGAIGVIPGTTIVPGNTGTAGAGSAVPQPPLNALQPGLRPFMPGMPTPMSSLENQLRAQSQPPQAATGGATIDLSRVPTILLKPQQSAPLPQLPLRSGPMPSTILQLPLQEAPAAPAPDQLDPAITYDAPVPLVPRERGLFGLAPAPFVEGDFVAALRLPDGHWSVVQPAPEPFPNSWQRRVLLWFAMAFAIVAPLGWLFARRMSKPLVAFAEAAEKLGRDPTAPVLDLDGPAEVGRAAHAFNVMQSRLKSFVGDRTAMIGAISHDLRTPLTRLRFRIEEVDDEATREGMIEEVEEMEEMINSVLAFIRDASSPGVRERIDLRTIVEDVAEDAAIVGNDVRIETMAPAPVDVDVMGMRRLFSNLFENAAKYGERARVRLLVDDADVVAQVIDEGPGVPVEDLERAFEPFYRAANARASDKRGSGLGLAVCRSIARAHGGDVTLRPSPEGFAAEVRIPLAFEARELAVVSA